MFKKLSSMATATLLFAAGLAVMAAAPANATSPSLTWNPYPLNQTNPISNPSFSTISGNGNTKVQFNYAANAEIYVSRNSSSWVVATGTSTVGSMRSGALDETGQNMVFVGSSVFGGGTPIVLVSNNYGSSFTAVTPYGDSEPRDSSKAAISPNGRTMIITTAKSSNGRTEIITSNDFGATWSYKDLGSSVSLGVAATSTTTAGVNAVFVKTGGGIAQHLFAASDTSSISGALSLVTGAASSDDTALGAITYFAVSPDGSKAITFPFNSDSYLQNVTINSSGQWSFSSQVTSTFSPATPTALKGSLYGDPYSFAISNDGLKVSFTYRVNMQTAPYTSTDYLFTSQDAGLNFSTPKSESSRGNPQIAMTADGVKQYAMIGRAFFLSTDSGISFTSDTAQLTTTAKITSISGSVDGSVLLMSAGGFTSPPSLLVSQDFGATALSFDVTGGSSSLYPFASSVSADGTRLMSQLRNYSTNPSTDTLKEFYGTNFASSRTLNLPTGVTLLQNSSFSPDLSKVLIAANSGSSAGQLYFGSVSDGVVTWSTALGDSTTYSSLIVTNSGFHAISVSQAKLYSATISAGTLGSVTTNSSAFSNGFVGSWSRISSSSTGQYLVVANYGALSNNCYAGGFVYKSADFGATWSVISSSTSSLVGAPGINSDGSIIGYGLVGGGSMKISTDGGATFADQTSLGTISCVTSVGPSSGLRNWYAPFFFTTSASNFGVAVSSSTSVLNVSGGPAGSTPAPSTPTLTDEQIAAAGAEAARVAAIAAEVARVAAIAVAKVELQGVLKIGKAGTLAQYQAADYFPANEKTVARVNEAVLKLAVADRENTDKIKAIVKTENFIEQVSTVATQKSVTSGQIVELKLISADSRNKASVTSAIKKSPAASLTSLASVQAVVDAHLASIKAQKERSAAIKAKIAARNK